MRGIEKIWLIGDEFAYKHLEKNFCKNKKADGTSNTYTYTFYEVREFLTSKYSNNCRSVLNRIRNSIATAINEHNVLPKVITIIPDEDIIREVIPKFDDEISTSYQFNKILEALCDMISNMLLAYKEMLPERAKRDNHPHILWISPPTHKYFSKHNNYNRDKFTKCLDSVVSGMKNMTMLRMIKFWNFDDGNLVLEHNETLTSEGMWKYWLSVDSAIRFWCVALSKKLDKSSSKLAKGIKTPNNLVIAKRMSSKKYFNPEKQRLNYDKYNWRKDKDSFHIRKRLPTPP